MRTKKFPLIVALVALALLLAPSASACGNCGVTITKEPLYSGYYLEDEHVCPGTGQTYPGGIVYHSDPTSGLELGVQYEWWVLIEIINWNSYTITNVRLADRFGAEFGVCIINYSGGTGGTPPETRVKGASEKVFLEWYIGSLGPGESATIALHVWTDRNPACHQEFTSYGDYDLNSGAVVKWLDCRGKQHSAETMPIELSTIEPPCM